VLGQQPLIEALRFQTRAADRIWNA